MEGHASAIRCVAFRPDGRQLATGANDHSVMIWDVDTGQSLHTILGHKKTVHAVVYSPDGSRLASVAEDGSLRLDDPHSGETLWSQPGHSVTAAALAFRPDGKQLAVAGENGEVLLRDVQTGGRIGVLAGAGRVATVAFDAGGSRLATAGSDNLRVWDLSLARPVQSLKMEGAEARHVFFDAADKTVTVLGRTGRVQVWNVEDGKLLRSETSPLAPGRKALAIDGRFVVTVEDNQKVRVWDRPR
jgi:WD40 repeat protein